MKKFLCIYIERETKSSIFKKSLDYSRDYENAKEVFRDLENLEPDFFKEIKKEIEDKDYQYYIRCYNEELELSSEFDVSLEIQQEKEKLINEYQEILYKYNHEKLIEIPQKLMQYVNIFKDCKQEYNNYIDKDEIKKDGLLLEDVLNLDLIERKFAEKIYQKINL